ncbi:MAG: hypothetical protein E4H28_07750 [Gemmatimonadales bacterium]|nr:MAG: hypothetical protein E4H28_07750 [Gemmatimonadales bacterium]
MHGRVFWEYAGSPTLFDVRWTIGIGGATAGVGVGNLSNNIDDTGTAASTLHVTDWTVLASSPALSSWDADSVMKLSLTRTATHANDTLDVDAYAVGVELEYQRVVGQQI